MRPIDFPESNLTLNPPAHMDKKDCKPLHIQTDGSVNLSVWKPTDDEIRVLIEGGVVVLRVLSGPINYPVSIQVENRNLDRDHDASLPEELSTVGARMAFREEGEWVSAYLAEEKTMEGAIKMSSVRTDVLRSVDGAFESWKSILSSWLRGVVSGASGKGEKEIFMIEREPPADA